MKPLVYGSVCSGIEAATQAWHPLGWRPAFFSEIDPFPRAVLSHHHPEVPLHGDFTTIKAGQYEPIDLLVGGTPCQSFSIAGLRKGLADDRGNLALEYILLADRLRPRWLVWENVPGVLSSKPGDPQDEDEGEEDGGLGHNGGPVFDADDGIPGEDFAAFLSGLVRWDVGIPPGGWRNSGIIAPGPVDGAYGVAWRVLDAQFVRTHQHPGAVPQRRRRVFVVGHLGGWRGPAAVLLERESLSGNPPPRRQAGAQPAEGAARRAAFGGNNCSGPIDVATARVAHGGPHGRLDFETETFIAEPAAIAFSCKDHGADAEEELSPTLRSMGHDTSHANGGGQVAVVVAFAVRGRDDGAVPEVHDDGQTVGTLRAAEGGSSRDYVAFQTRGSNIDLGEDGVTGTIGTNADRASGSAPMIAYSIYPESGQGADLRATEIDVAPGLNATSESAQTDRGTRIATTSAVRRLTPTECERLQGFPDGWTAIPWRGKPAEECADGPRYKALGNSMAVSVMEWIGRRIAEVDAMPQGEGK